MKILGTQILLYKGIAVRLDQGAGGVAAGNAWMMFDHDLMRMAGAWTGEGFYRLGSHFIQRKAQHFPQNYRKAACGK